MVGKSTKSKGILSYKNNKKKRSKSKSSKSKRRTPIKKKGNHLSIEKKLRKNIRIIFKNALRPKVK